MIVNPQTMTPEAASISLDAALDVVEALPDEQQGTLLKIIMNRLAERSRQAMISRVHQAKLDYQQGDAVRGNAAEIIKALSK